MATYTYVDIPNADVAVGAPLDTGLMTALRDNALAIGENVSNIPDASKPFLELADSGALGAGSSVVFSGLDLTTYNFLVIQFIGFTYISNTNHTIDGGLVAVVTSATTNGSAMLCLENGDIMQDAPSNVDTSTNVTRASTSFTISGLRNTGQIKLFGVK